MAKRGSCHPTPLELEILKVLQFCYESRCHRPLKLTAQSSQPLPVLLSPV